MAGSLEKHEITTISLEKKTKRQLKAAKKHPRETDDETVRRALSALQAVA